MSVLENSHRHRSVMLAVIHLYVETAEPVGSRTLVKQYDFDLSPATVRNVMADLEDEGYLVAPHTSAGRIPTEIAYRYYVNEILRARVLQAEGSQKVREELLSYQGSVDELARKTSRVLSNLSSYAGIVLAPNRLYSTFKNVNFVRIKSRVVLVVLVSRSGISENRLIKMDQDFSQEALENMSGYLNDRYQGLSLGQMRGRLTDDMRRDKENYDLLMNAALELGKKMLDSEDGTDVYVEGSSKI
ncbi:MAG: heat-inducible transcriptional repressor HrcA, partial [bacterium]